jgi:hypothetical protein
MMPLSLQKKCMPDFSKMESQIMHEQRKPCKKLYVAFENDMAVTLLRTGFHSSM